MAIVLIQAVNATICEDRLTPGQLCRMLTPSLDCEGNYTIYNETGYLTTGNMTLLNDSIYYFNFSQGEGSYLIQLCDNSTREIVVIGDEDTMIIGTAIVMVAMIGLFVYLAITFSKEDNFFYYLFYLFIYLAMLVPLFGIRIIADTTGLAASHAALLNSLYKIYLYFYLFMVVMLIVYMIILFISWIYHYNKTPKWKRNLKEF